MPTQPECFFAQSLREGVTPLELPPISEDASEDEVRAYGQTELCKRADCRLTVEAALGYVTAAGRIEPIAAMERCVPQDCTWRDITGRNDTPTG